MFAAEIIAGLAGLLTLGLDPDKAGYVPAAGVLLMAVVGVGVHVRSGVLMSMLRCRAHVLDSYRVAKSRARDRPRTGDGDPRGPPLDSGSASASGPAYDGESSD